MGRTTTLEERVLFRELARAGHTDVEIAEQTGWSLPTVRKWRRRGSRGRQALVSVMGRPLIGALPVLAREYLPVPHLRDSSRPAVRTPWVGPQDLASRTGNG